MIEIVLIVMMCVLMGRFASASNRSAGKWIALTVVACIAALFVPLPYIRVLIVGVVVFFAMMITNKV